MATQVWVGFARNLSAREVIGRYLDPLAVDPEPFSAFADEASASDDEAPISELQASFGGEHVGPGSYEAYDVTDLDGGALDAASFLIHAPFEVELPGLSASAERETATAAFFVAQSGEPGRRDDGTLVITDVVRVVFDWEQAVSASLGARTLNAVNLFTGRLDERRLEGSREDANAGEWGVALECLCDNLHELCIPISVEERDRLVQLATDLGVKLSRITMLNELVDVGKGR